MKTKRKKTSDEMRKANPHRADLGRYSNAKGVAQYTHPEGTLVRHKETGRQHLVQGHTDDGQVMTTGGKFEADQLEKVTIGKSQPGVGDVHATTSLGNDGKKRKAKDFLSTIAENKGTVVDKDGAMKKAQQVEWKGTIKITKTDEEQQLVFGWASVTHINGEVVIDKQGDIITSEELEKAAYDFVLYCREQGDMHERRGVGKLVESCVFTEEKAAKCGLLAFDPETNEQMFGWFTGFKVNDTATWKLHKDGKRPEFSIGGRAIRVPVEEAA